MTARNYHATMSKRDAVPWWRWRERRSLLERAEGFRRVAVRLIMESEAIDDADEKRERQIRRLPSLRARVERSGLL